CVDLPLAKAVVAEVRPRVAAGERVWIGFGHGEVDWEVIQDDATIYKNDDPELNKRLRATFQKRDAVTRLPLDFQVVARVGETLVLQGTSGSQQVSVASEQVLEPARKHPASEAIIREKLARLGATTFELRHLDVVLDGNPMVPSSLLNELRRRATDQLSEQLAEPPRRTLNLNAGRQLLEPITSEVDPRASEQPVQLSVLCRTMEQAEAAANAKVDCVYVDFHDVREYREARARMAEHNVPLGIATVRMQKPGEMGLLRVLRRHTPDLILARNLAAINFCRNESIPFVADFSLNVANHRTSEWLRDLGAGRITASYDLNREQLMDLVASIPSDWLEVVLHQHIPMFHMEHCVFCSVLSPGTNKTNCGRPCDRHVVQLRDRVGAEHTLQADVACRNTLYNATPQSGAEVVADLQRQGVRSFRLEMLEESGDRMQEIIRLYRRLLANEISAETVWKSLSALNRVGVTRGTLESKRNPLAIL
ncbi:MAG: DUF3656 domain-containing protein, partial [Planctomycetota bacterium]